MDKAYIVVFDDEGGLTFPYSWHETCDGALGGDGPVALFATTGEARHAIRVTTAHAKLRQLQGETYDSDFIQHVKQIKIRACKGRPNDS